MQVRLQDAKDNFNETKAVVSDVMSASKVAKKIVVNLDSAIKAFKKVNNDF
jgi:hypothetical protein